MTQAPQRRRRRLRAAARSSRATSIAWRPRCSTPSCAQALARVRRRARRHRLPDRRLGRLHRRPAVRLRRRARRDGLVAAAAGPRTSRWTRAFAAYYAWMRMQAGECDTAIVVGHGKTSEGEPERVLNLQLDPYYQAPLGLDPTATAALQASAYMARTGATDARPRRRSRRATAPPARAIPTRRCARRRSADELQQTPWAVEPLRTRLPAAGRRERRRAWSSPPRARRRRCATRPVWIHGVDQRTEMQTLGARDLSRSASAAARGARRRCAMAGLRSARRGRRRRAAAPRRRPRR